MAPEVIQNSEGYNEKVSRPSTVASGVLLVYPIFCVCLTCFLALSNLVYSASGLDFSRQIYGLLE